MEIEQSQELGLCFGVRRAIQLLKEAAGKYGRIETLGPVAHNQQLVQGLAQLGISPVDELEQVKGEILGIPTHGIGPSVLCEIEARHIHIIDTTCPIVRKAQNMANELAEAGFDIIVFGEAEHSEVKGLLGWANGKGIAALNVEQITRYEQAKQFQKGRLCPHCPLLGRGRLGIISQTTQDHSAFMRFTAQLLATCTPGVNEIRVVNTLCQATQKRREAAMHLAKRSQLMIVVGGHNSANTKRLAEACSPIVETHQVERASEVNDSWLAGKQQVGITAAASTPDEAIEEVVAKLKFL